MPKMSIIICLFLSGRPRLDTKTNQKSQENSMLLRTKACARPLNFPAHAPNINTLEDIGNVALVKSL